MDNHQFESLPFSSIPGDVVGKWIKLSYIYDLVSSTPFQRISIR